MLETICDIMIDAYKRNWITSRDGNVSIRHHGRDHFYVTPSGVRKQTLQPDQFKKIKILNVPHVPTPMLIRPVMLSSWEDMPYTDISTNLRPSGELPMHFGLQTKIDTEVRVIMHFHPTYTTAAMYAGIDLQNLLNEFPELSRYTTVGPTVPMLPPVTQDLADACIKNIGLNADTGEIKYNIIGMDRHGVVAVDTSPWRAYEHIERLEHICKIVLASGKY
jgi:ribulose-5-phosphate 4-epimerase/fuculose-1-phosphate aldolase